MQKTIAVLFGGCSPEYEVSLQSAHAIITHIDRNRYDVLMIGITEDGDWYFYNGDEDNILKNSWYQKESCVPAMISPNRSLHGLIVLEDEKIRVIHVDAVLPVLHGRNGEDGTVQGLLELAGIPVIGCGVLASSVCMDKDMAHRIVKEAGICVPEGIRLHNPAQKAEAQEWARNQKFPLFVKPMKAGSSFGITKIHTAEELDQALRSAFSYDDEVVIEEAIDGFEVGCAVLGNRKLQVGIPDEIELSQGFFDYTEKYTLKTSRIHVPARISDVMKKEIQNTAIKIYKALGCKGFARVDMFLTSDNRLVFNEVNTIPGCTAHSRFPGMMACAGVDFEKLIEQMISTAFEDQSDEY